MSDVHATAAKRAGPQATLPPTASRPADGPDALPTPDAPPALPTSGAPASGPKEGPPPAVEAPSRPNIVVFYVDDVSPIDGRLWNDRS